MQLLELVLKFLHYMIIYLEIVQFSGKRKGVRI